jgi:hypothetical protein
MESAEKTEISIGANYMEFVYKFHNTMLKNRLTLVYEGEINQTITKAFTSLAEKNMDESNENVTVKKRVYHVMVECLQNICKHADDPNTGLPYKDGSGSGIFIVGQNETEYTITTGNTITNDKVVVIRSILEQINTLNAEQLKELYKKQMLEARLSDKAGAGLGFIDIAKKTGNPLNFDFIPLNDATTFFVLKTTISRT